jgi:hypothetical protein
VSELHLSEIYKTVRALLFVAAFCIVAFFVRDLFHKPSGALPPVAATPAEREIQAVIDAQKLLAASQGGVPAYAAPAVAVLHDVMPGFTGAQIASILGALKPKTVTVANAKLVGPTPAPTPTPGAFTAEQIATLYGADKSAVADVLADPQTHIAVTLSQQEVPVSRVGSMFTSSGAGLGIAVLRHGHWEFNVGAVTRGSHLSPAINPAWMIPHTQLSVGPAFVFDKSLHVGFGATIHF